MTAARFVVRCAARARRTIGARRGRRSSICSRTRSTACCSSIREFPGKRIRELIEPLGYDGSKTILDDYLREVRPLFERRRTYQRTVYRPGELLQLDLWEPGGEIPVGHGQTRRGWVVTAELGWSRAIAGALIFSKEWQDIAFGMARCLTRLGALPETLVWDREGAIHAGAASRPTRSPASAASLRWGG
jgi:hypothetical protein